VIYMFWQINDMKAPLSESVQQALDYHKKKYGRVPNLVEHGQLLQNLPPIAGVRYMPIRIPSNFLFLGVEDQDAQILLEVEKLSV
jgi:hypothetical protein